MWHFGPCSTLKVPSRRVDTKLGKDLSKELYKLLRGAGEGKAETLLHARGDCAAVEKLEGGVPPL